MESKQRKMPWGVYKTKTHRVYMLLRPLMIFAVSVVIVAFASGFVIRSIISAFLAPVDSGDATPVQIEIAGSASASQIADLLYKEKLVRNKSVFKIYVDFYGKAAKLRTGNYTLSRNMEISEIVDELLKGNPPRSVVVFTIPEGMTIKEIAATLIKKNVIPSESALTDLCKKGENFAQYDFLKDLGGSRDFQLEGYLFPDTYEVYADASPESTINKLLTRFFNIYTDDYIERANELNMTMDEVITLASMIEKEAKAADFVKVSAVFHNRLKAEQPLESCATVQYIYNERKLVFSARELANPSPYNTYRHAGLPAGPICNPGKAAIEAALYPAEDFIKDNYLYFCLKDPETGELDFSRTFKEHEGKVAQYEDSWQQFDAALGQGQA